MSLTVRRAEPGDADRIAEFAIKLVEQHVDYDPVRFSRIGSLEGMADFYARQTEVDNAVVLVAEIEGDIIGFAYMQFEPIIYAELATKVAWLHDILVDTALRGTGAGKKMIEAMASEAKRLGANKVLLSVAARNTDAQEFFARSGFRTTMHEMMLVLGE